MERTLRHLRIALKFSLWMWVLYWPLSGLMLLAEGMRDPTSLAVLAIMVLGFVLVIRAGGVKASASSNMKQFVLERPMYIIGGAIAFTILATFFDPLQNIGLTLFALLWFVSIVMIGVATSRHVKAHDLAWRQSGADQVMIGVAITGFAALLIFLDAGLSLLETSTTPASTMSLIIVNLTAIFYPALMLLATRPFREPLQDPLRAPKTAKDDAPAKAPTPAATETS